MDERDSELAWEFECERDTGVRSIGGRALFELNDFGDVSCWFGCGGHWRRGGTSNFSFSLDEMLGSEGEVDKTLSVLPVFLKRCKRAFIFNYAVFGDDSDDDENGDERYRASDE